MHKNFLLVLLLLIVYSCGDSYEKTTLWKIEGNGITQPSYLFGTIHIGCNIKLRKKVLKALEETETLVMELEPEEMWPEQTDEDEYIKIPNGKTLKEHMTPDEYALVRDYFLNFLEFDLDLYPTIHPITLGVTTVPPELRCYEYDSYEGVLTDAANENNKEIAGLETSQFQLETIASASVEEHVGYLIRAAKTGKPTSSDPLRMLVIHYKNQDLDGLSRIIFSDKYFKSFRMNEALLDKRNVNWLPKIDSMVNKRPTLVAVGVGHLIGEKGLIRLLEEKGYELIPVLK